MHRNRSHKLADVIAAYKPGMELELRVRLKQESWEAMYNQIVGSATAKLSETISIVMEGAAFRRKEISFRNNERQSEEYIEKTSVRTYRCDRPVEYKVILSTERVIDKFDVPNCKLVRIKLRMSLVSGDWRYDFSYVRTLDCKQLGNVNAIRTRIFPSKTLTPDKFLQHLRSLGAPGVSVSFELEVEYVGPGIPTESEITQITDKLFKSDSGRSRYHRYIYDIARLVLADQDSVRNVSSAFRSGSLKQLTNQPISFNQVDWIKIVSRIDHYYLSDKADGERCFIWIRPEEIVLIARSIIDITKIAVSSGLELAAFTNTILDAEVLDLREDSFSRAYVFDVLYHGTKTTQLPMHERDSLLERICAKTGKLIQKKIQVRLSSGEDPDSNYQIQIKKLYSRKSRLYEIDGLIFTPDFADTIRFNKPEHYFDMVVYKWKPPERTTIDFLVMKAPEQLLGVKPYEQRPGFKLCILFCGISASLFRSMGLEHIPKYKEIFAGLTLRHDYFPVHFTSPLDPKAYLYYHPDDFKLDTAVTVDMLHQHVAEFRYTDGWKLEKLRPDKDLLIEKGVSYGNDFRVAVETFSYYSNPFTLDQLVHPESGGAEQYFVTEKQSVYKAMTKFNLFVKAQLLRQLHDSNLVVDLASGKGQDLYVYNGFRVKTTIFVEIDKEATVELARRAGKMDDMTLYKFNQKPNVNMTVHVINADLKDTKRAYDAIQEFTKAADGVVINFALHYLVEDRAGLDNFVSFVHSILRPGGVFIFTAFSGARVFELLRNIPTDESWDVHEAGKLKYSIRKLYNAKELADFGQQISVLHPFSDGRYYDEYLLNFDVVLQAFAKLSYVVIQNSSFGDWLDKYKAFDKRLYDNMSPNDKKYSSLYWHVTLQRPY